MLASTEQHSADLDGQPPLAGLEEQAATGRLERVTAVHQPDIGATGTHRRSDRT
jgi:hypothetical protein